MGRKDRFPKTKIDIDNQKIPRATAFISQKKIPIIQESVTLYSDHKASWRIGKIQLVEPYGWHILGAADIQQIKQKLASLEKNTWNEIFVRDRHFNHQIRCDELKCPKARKWMQANMPDQPYLWTIRVTAKERIWGILAEEAYHVIFWDPQHLIWEISKR